MLPDRLRRQESSPARSQATMMPANKLGGDVFDEAAAHQRLSLELHTTLVHFGKEAPTGGIDGADSGQVKSNAAASASQFRPRIERFINPLARKFSLELDDSGLVRLTGSDS
jgi:hypothetical protein